MTEHETLVILATLQTAYPHSFKDADPDTTCKLWQLMFASDDYEQVAAAVYALIASRKEGYSPTIGEVKEKLRLLYGQKELTEQEAWALVFKALSNGYYGYKTEYEKLPPEVQKAVGRPEQLREWAMMQTDTVQSVVASNFMRSYRVMLTREKELAALPPDFRLRLSGLADSMAMLPEGEK